MNPPDISQTASSKTVSGFSLSRRARQAVEPERGDAREQQGHAEAREPVTQRRDLEQDLRACRCPSLGRTARGSAAG